LRGVFRYSATRRITDYPLFATKRTYAAVSKVSMRSNLWSVVVVMLIGCDRRADLTLPAGEPAVLEPGYANVPPSAEWRQPSCQPAEPSSHPVIELLSGGGFSGGGDGNVQIFEDGTVMFDGGGCPDGAHRRGKLPAARVAALLDKLERSGFYDWPCTNGGCPDAFTASLTVHRGNSENTVHDAGCRTAPIEVTSAIELVRRTVGKNACSPGCRMTPDAAYCR
jgi:hypothetical protein